MENQILQQLDSRQLAILQDKLAGWEIVENYIDSKSRHVVVKPSYVDDTLEQRAYDHKISSRFILYFYDICINDMDYIKMLFYESNIIQTSRDYMSNSKELGISDGKYLPYTKFTIDLITLIDISCSVC